MKLINHWLLPNKKQQSMITVYLKCSILHVDSDSIFLDIKVVK